MLSYLEYLRDLHRVVQPRSSLEIGVRHGRSLALAACPAVGVDPRPEVTCEIGPAARVHPMTSDAFFAAGDGLADLPGRTIDLAFIDGMHLVEYAFRDFVNVERHCGPGGVVVLDDMLPRTVLEAARRRRTRAWTGDVWKVRSVLEQRRPDLVLLPVAVKPTGVLVVLCPDPAQQPAADLSRWQLRRLRRTTAPPESVLRRTGAVDPTDLLAAPFWATLRAVRAGASDADAVRRDVRAWRPKPLSAEQVEQSKGSTRRG